MFIKKKVNIFLIFLIDIIIQDNSLRERKDNIVCFYILYNKLLIEK